MKINYRELKEAADELGYKLVKKQQDVKLLPCACGQKRNLHMCYVIDKGEKWFFIRCKKCYLDGSESKTKQSAKIAWNKMVEKIRSKNGTTD